MKNNQKGITLIALVVTIIVLLILAGVSIAMLTGQNGILNRASEASYQSKLQNVAETMSFNVTNEITEYYNKAYVDGGAQTGESSAGEAISKGITDSIDNEKAKSDSDVAVDNDTKVTDGEISGTVTLTYGGHKKVGTVSNESGISWAEIEEE